MHGAVQPVVIYNSVYNLSGQYKENGSLKKIHLLGRQAFLTMMVMTMERDGDDSGPPRNVKTQA